MSKYYQPQFGTVAAMTIAHLKTLKPGSELSNRQICAALGRQVDGIATLLAPAVAACLLSKRIVKEAGAPASLLWSLGSSSPGYLPPPDTLRAAADEKRVIVHESAALVPSIFAFAAKQGAAPFSVALATDGRLTIQRHGITVLELTDIERKALVEAATNGVRP